MELPKRKSKRLKNYNYSQNGAYFLTMVTRDRQNLFGKIIAETADPIEPFADEPIPEMEISNYGMIVKHQIDEMASIYDYLDIEKYVIMPNHIHLIVMIHTDDDNSAPPTTPANAIISAFVSTLKRYTNRKMGVSAWQRSYHDRIIRNEREHKKIWEYIDSNPLRWTWNNVVEDGDGV